VIKCSYGIDNVKQSNIKIGWKRDYHEE
jgi:hypothetical protein